MTERIRCVLVPRPRGSVHQEGASRRSAGGVQHALTDCSAGVEQPQPFEVCSGSPQPHPLDAAGAVGSGAPPQQPSGPPHEGSVPWIQPLMIAAAHPTPGVSVMAPHAQLVAHAPHSMQPSRSTISARLSAPIEKTACGHTAVHTPHPVQSEVSSCSVATPSMYRRVFICMPIYRRNFCANTKSSATVTATACRGSDLRSSSSTPEGEV